MSISNGWHPHHPTAGCRHANSDLTLHARPMYIVGCYLHPYAPPCCSALTSTLPVRTTLLQCWMPRPGSPHNGRTAPRGLLPLSAHPPTGLQNRHVTVRMPLHACHNWCATTHSATSSSAEILTSRGVATMQVTTRSAHTKVPSAHDTAASGHD